MRFFARRSAERHTTPPQAVFARTLAAQMRHAVLEAILHSGAAAGDRAALTVERSPVPIAPALLAQAQPAGPARDEACRLYERCLAYYRGTVRAQDEALGIDDVGAAVAAFVAANVCALQGGTITMPLLLQIERQIGGIVRLGNDWDNAPASDRQAYFEQLAVIAVLVAETSAQAAKQGRRAIANVQRAARGYLEQFLGVDADDLAIGPGGLAARQRA